METPTIEYCNKCKQHTLHDLKAHTLDIDDFEAKEEAFYVEWGRKLYQIFECTLCKDTFGRTRNKQTCLDTNPLTVINYRNYTYSEKYHPPRLLKTLPVKKFGTMPSILFNAYEEIIFCYNNDKLITCSATIKILKEGVCDFFLAKKEDVKERKSIVSVNRIVLKMSINEALNCAVTFSSFLTFKGLHNPNKAELRIVIELMEDWLIKLFPSKTKQPTP